MLVSSAMARSSFMVGEARPVAGVRLDQGDRDYVYARVDPEADAVVGLQIEHFLSCAIAQHPISSTCSTLPPWPGSVALSST
jgi:hypothetical protein